MTAAVLRNLFAKRATRRYPYEVREPFEGVRGELVNEIDICIFCSACAMKCPSQCIVVDKSAAKWTCDPFACVYCGICVDACPVHCLHQNKKYRHATQEREIISLTGTVKEKKKKAPEPADPTVAAEPAQ
ncbi:MAG: 4Fe-4S binding protein [Syntrophobacteraceae bacterium]